MLHIFVDPGAQQGDLLTVTGSEVNHICNVLRMQPGDEVAVSNGADAREYRYGIEELREDSVLLRLRFVKEAEVELPVRVTLFQGLPKADKMDWIVQKCVELGVGEIVPVSMERCIAKLNEQERPQNRALAVDCGGGGQAEPPGASPRRQGADVHAAGRGVRPAHAGPAPAL